jgi:hypothetical protein
MTSVTFITNSEYKATLRQDVGGLMFSGHLYDCGKNIDKTKLRKDFKEQLKGKRVHAVLIYTEDSPEFSKTPNTLVKYKSPSVADKNQEGAFQRDHPHPQIAQMWWTNHPMGDVIVVYTETKSKEAEAEVKVDGVPSAAELKTLRKEWRDLKVRYERLGSRPRSYSGDHLEDLERTEKKGRAHDRKTKPILYEMLDKAAILIQHDTPTIQKQVSNWANRAAFVRWDKMWMDCWGHPYKFN